MLDRHCGVLPTGIGRSGKANARQAGTVLPDLPQRHRFRGIGHDDPIRRPGCSKQRIGAYPELGQILVDQLDKHPTVPARQRWHGSLTSRAPYHIHDPPVQAFTRGRAVINNQRRSICGIGHRRIAEHDHDLVRRIRHQPNRGADDHGKRALAASQESRHVEAVLRQQMLQAVARHLAREAPELGADHAEICLHH